MADTDLERALAKLVELERENHRLRHAIDGAAEWLRGPLRADTLNEAIRELNTVIAPQDRIPEVAWGVASLGALQTAVRNLAFMVALPEHASFLHQRIDHMPPAPMKRQRPGGFPV